MVDAFRTHIMQTKELGTCPVKQIGGCSFFYMRISNVYIVIVVSSNANVACAFKFVVEVFSLCFSLPLIWCLALSIKLWFKMCALVLFYSILRRLSETKALLSLLLVHDFLLASYSLCLIIINIYIWLYKWLLYVFFFHFFCRLLHYSNHILVAPLTRMQFATILYSFMSF